MPFLQLENNASLHYFSHGSGIPILYIHPPMLSHKNFTYQAMGLSSHFQNIIFDIRGHGLSSPSAQPLTYSLIVEDMRRLLDHLEVPEIILCGYSTGGSVALEFMLTYPKRVKKGIIVSGMSEVNDWFTKRLIILAEKFIKVGAVKPLAFLNAIGNADSLSCFLQLYHEGHNGNKKNMVEYFHDSLVYNCTDHLDEILQPILLIYGTKDKLFLPYGRLLQRHLPHSIMELIPKVHHQIPTKAGAELNQFIIDFCK